MPILYSYFRSSSSFRVRIALHLKGIFCDYRYVNLKPDISEQNSDSFLSINPQGRVPFFIDDQVRISQATAIIEYLEEAYPEIALLPESSRDRAWVRQLVNIIACDIQPLNNISVLTRLRIQFNGNQESLNAWYSYWIGLGFAAIESLLKNQVGNGFYCFGGISTMADIYLIPQVWNAQRFNVALSAYPNIMRIYNHCMKQEAFQLAAPEQQQDAP